MNNSAYKKAADGFDRGWYCAESVLKVIAHKEGITSKLIPRIATGFCAGISRTCGICGALSGGILALSLVYGRDAIDESVQENYDAVNKLIKKFQKKFGSTNCEKLTGCDLGTPAGQNKFTENNLHFDCREFTGKVAEFVSEIIAEGKNK